MFKTISAAAIALSLIAAPAFAQGAGPASEPAAATTQLKKPVVHKVHKTQKHAAKHKVRKHVAHKHVAKKHIVKKHAAKKHVVKKHVKLKSAKAIKTVKPKAAI